jgi:hypothetical protein
MTKPIDLKDHDLLIRVDSRQSDMASSLDEIKTSIKGLPGIFASREELKDVAKETEIRIQVLEEAIQGPKKYIAPIFAAIASSTVTFLVISYFEMRKGL